MSIKNSLRTLFAIFLCNFLFNHASGQELKRVTTKTSFIEVIDFHSTRRCATCNAIEEKSKAVLEKHYRTEMLEGRITFQTVNVDKSENRKISEEFQAAGTALFIHIVKNGQSTAIDLTNFAFMNAMSENDDFEEGLKKELDKALKAINT